MPVILSRESVFIDGAPYKVMGGAWTLAVCCVRIESLLCAGPVLSVMGEQ